MYSIRGEVDYISQQRKIGGEFEHIGEVVREVGVSNAYDAYANNIYLFPLHMISASCLIVVDDGDGMDTTQLTKEQLQGCNGAACSSLASYFHIGHSTKKAGEGIGQFSMGANLALAQADALFVLLTRTNEVEAGKVWVVIQAKMNDAFSDRNKEVSAKLMSFSDAIDAVQVALQEENALMAQAWAAWVNKAFAFLPENHGTLQLIVSKETELHRRQFLDVSQASWVPPQKRNSKMISKPLHATQFYNYIRFQTRHGSFLAFPTSTSQHAYKTCELRQRQPYSSVYARDMRKATLRIFCDSAPEGEIVPYGFPYIEYHNRLEPSVGNDEISSRSRLESMTSYWARLGPIEFTRDTATGLRSPVAVFGVMDSYNMKMEQYEGLDRSGKTRSGVSMCKMQGFVLTTHGCYLTTIRGDAADRILKALITTNDIDLQNAALSTLQIETKQALLAWNEKKGLQNLMIVIDGIFEMKTDRNGVTPSEMSRLHTDKKFLIGLGNALQSFRSGTDGHAKTFNQMLTFMDQTCKGDAEKDIRDYCTRRAYETLNAGTVRVLPNSNLPVAIHQALDVVSETQALPGQGHEHSLVHLFFLYGAAVRSINRALATVPPQGARVVDFYRCLPFWARLGLLFNAQGIDAQIFDWPSSHDDVCFGTGIHDAVHKMKQFEFKVELESTFNHPFQACDCIVVNSIHNDLVHVTDSQSFQAQVDRPPPGDPLHGLGVYLRDIKRGMQSAMSRVDRSVRLEIPVIVFTDLLKTTFQAFANVQVVEPTVPPIFTEPKKTGQNRGSKRRKR